MYETYPFGGTAVQRPAMGRFTHEAAAADPVRKVVYLTEDETNGRFYRFVPATWGDLSAGTLQVMVAGSATSGSFTWANVPDPDGSPTLTRNQVSGSKSFNGGEGCYYANDTVWFTTKGDNRVWQVNLANNTYELAYDDSLVSSGTPPLTGVDNVTGTTSGDLYVAEDGGNMEICMITPDDKISPVPAHHRPELLGDHRPGLQPGGRPPLLLVPARDVRARRRAASPTASPARSAAEPGGGGRLRPARRAAAPPPLARLTPRSLEGGQPGRQHRFEAFGVLRGEGVEQASFVGHVLGERGVDQLQARRGERHHAPSAVRLAGPPRDEPGLFQPVDPLGHRARGHHGVGAASSLGRPLEGLARPAQRGQHVELALGQPEPPVDEAEPLGQMPADPVEPPDDPGRADVDVGPLTGPFLLDARDVIHHARQNIASREAILTSMEATWRWVPVTAIAPIAWGTTYYVTHAYLPADHPLYARGVPRPPRRAAAARC